MPKLSGINHQRAVRAFQKAGFRIAREGKHITMTNGDRIITIPRADPVIELDVLGKKQKAVLSQS